MHCQSLKRPKVSEGSGPLPKIVGVADECQQGRRVAQD
jgi:hypothetical protein